MSQTAPIRYSSIGYVLREHAVEASLATTLVVLETAWLGALAYGLWKVGCWLMS